jgi:maleate cis-trans isomerase
MYGTRARIGYTSVAFVTEIFPYAFYKMVPPGVSLALLTLHQTELTRGEMDRLYEETMRAARALAKSGVDLIVLGGRPVFLSRGENLDEITGRLTKELGVPVTSDASAQLAAFKALGSQRVGTVHPFDPHEDERHDRMIAQLGLTPVGSFGGGSNLVELPKLECDRALDWGRAFLKTHPETDTLLFPCPHWATVEAIDQLESEFGVSVVANLQTTVWHALRLCGIKDSIKRYGRLLRDF